MAVVELGEEALAVELDGGALGEGELEGALKGEETRGEGALAVEDAGLFVEQSADAGLGAAAQGEGQDQ